MLKSIGIFCLVFAPSLSAATSFGDVDFQTTFSTGSAFISFVGGSPAHSESTDPGTIVGANASGTRTALGTNFVGGVIDAHSTLNLAAGVATSISGAKAEAFSGVVRVTNTGGVSAIYSLNQTLFYSANAAGPDSASVGISAVIEAFNVGTGLWESVGSTSFGVGTGQSNTACAAGCVGSSGYSLAASSFVDVRLHTLVQASLSQAGTAVPEPATFALVGLSLLALGALRRRVR